MLKIMVCLPCNQGKQKEYVDHPVHSPLGHLKLWCLHCSEKIHDGQELLKSYLCLIQVIFAKQLNGEVENRCCVGIQWKFLEWSFGMTSLSKLFATHAEKRWRRFHVWWAFLLVVFEVVTLPLFSSIMIGALGRLVGSSIYNTYSNI